MRRVEQRADKPVAVRRVAGGWPADNSTAGDAAAGGNAAARAVAR